MPILYVRDVPEQLYQQARQIATARGSSLSAFVVTVLEQAVQDEKLRRTRAKTLAKIRRRRRVLDAGAPDSVTVLRQIRNEGE